MKSKTYVAIDTETTGLSAARDSILQVGAVKFDNNGNVLDTYSHLFRPKVDFIPEEATAINGITLDMVKDCSYYHLNKSTIMEFCDGLPLVGHNIEFDLGFLDFHDYVKMPEIVDTMIMAKLAWKIKSRPTLEFCCKRAHIMGDKYHSALFDAKQTMRLFLYLKNIVKQYEMKFSYDEKQQTYVPLDHHPVMFYEGNDIGMWNGDLVIPFNSPVEYHWWKEGVLLDVKFIDFEQIKSLARARL